MVARATKHGIYASDIMQTNYSRRVDDHLFTQAVLGWDVYDGDPPLTPIGTWLRPRHAVGIDETGRTHSVVVAQTTADLWTRASLQWNVLGDDGALVAVTMTGLVGEAATFGAIG